MVVKPALSHPVGMNIHIIPQQNIALPEVRDEVVNMAVAFFKTLAPGDTFFVAQLIDVLMNNPKIISLRIYETTGGSKQDDSAPSKDVSLRTKASLINIIPAAEDE